jgi:hypothetical protein
LLKRRVGESYRISPESEWPAGFVLVPVPASFPVWWRSPVFILRIESC